MKRYIKCSEDEQIYLIYFTVEFDNPSGNLSTNLYELEKLRLVEEYTQDIQDLKRNMRKVVKDVLSEGNNIELQSIVVLPNPKELQYIQLVAEFTIIDYDNAILNENQFASDLQYHLEEHINLMGGEITKFEVEQ